MKEILWNRKTVSIALLAVVLPISLVVAFQLTNTRKEPELETVTVEVASWQIDRPLCHVHFNKKVENFYDNNEVSLVISAYVCTYSENSSSLPFDDRDGVRLNIHRWRRSRTMSNLVCLERQRLCGLRCHRHSQPNG